MQYINSKWLSSPDSLFALTGDQSRERNSQACVQALLSKDDDVSHPVCHIQSTE
jgi:hypothetical protein